jgi:hypothetical protein
MHSIHQYTMAMAFVGGSMPTMYIPRRRNAQHSPTHNGHGIRWWIDAYHVHTKETQCTAFTNTQWPWHPVRCATNGLTMMANECLCGGLHGRVTKQWKF